MQRRLRKGMLSADDLVALGSRAEVAGQGLTRAGRARAISAFLSEHGADPVTVAQAAYWVRRGRPADDGPARDQGWA